MGLFDFFSGNHEIGSKRNPVVINAKEEVQAVASEYKWLIDKYGPQEEAWSFVSQSLTQEWRKTLDMLRIKLKEGGIIEIWFDITATYPANDDSGMALIAHEIAHSAAAEGVDLSVLDNKPKSD